MNHPFIFTGNLVFRKPSRPFVESMAPDVIQGPLNDARFLEAVYIASPVLHAQCIKLLEGKIMDSKAIQKIHISLMKYYQRMFSRCTPFGLFASCGTVQWSKGESSYYENHQSVFRHTKLDMHYLCRLAAHLNALPPVKNNINWYPSTSLYSVAGTYRYIEYEYVNDTRLYKISSVEYSDILKTILEAASGGSMLKDTNSLLMELGYDIQDCESFLEQLICSQILVSDLEPAVTGDDFLQQMIRVLEQIETDAPELKSLLLSLKKIRMLLLEMDRVNNGNLGLYAIIKEVLDTIGVPYDESRLFQVDMFHSIKNAALADKWKQKLLDAFAFLSGFRKFHPNRNLELFSKQFKERYEERWVPLNEALDADAGIGYTDEISNTFSPLLDQLDISGPKESKMNFVWNQTESWLFQKLLTATAGKQYEVEITGEEAARFPTVWENLPPSVAAVFSITENEQLLLEGITAGAANLLGRFANGQPEIHALANEITELEQKINPDVLFAEIVHLPENRTGNIMLRPVLRPYEILFLAKSSVCSEFQISLNDLHVTVNQGEIILYSEKLARRIIPRLSTAHHFSGSTLPVYRFLCDLQTQNQQQNFGFNWGVLSREFSFLPRVVYKGVILFEACWQLKHSELIELISADKEKLMDAARVFFTKWHMPDFVVLADGDNELLVNRHHELSILSFIQTVRKRDAILIKEFFKPGENSAHDKDARFVHQYIAPLVNINKTTRSFTPHPAYPAASVDATIQRTFLPGSEWLYIKLYCGQGSAAHILTAAIKPLVQTLASAALTDRWFFIRYMDPGYHIRLRLHVKDAARVGKVIIFCHKLLTPLLQNGFISKMEHATYEREIERYGPATMVLSEAFFHVNSEAILDFLCGHPSQEEGMFWGICYADSLLHEFGFSLEQKCVLLQNLGESFAKEFKMDKPAQSRVNSSYNKIKRQLFQILDNKPAGDEHAAGSAMTAARQDIRQVAARLLFILGKKNTPGFTEKLMGSFLHMHFNRLLPSDHRLHELLLYSFMYKYYHAKIQMSKQAKVEP